MTVSIPIPTWNGWVDVIPGPLDYPPPEWTPMPLPRARVWQSKKSGRWAWQLPIPGGGPINGPAPTCEDAHRIVRLLISIYWRETIS